MRKVSIFLLVGLMLVGGLAVGVSANNDGGSASNNEAPSGPVSDATVNTNATAQINTIVALYVHSGVSLGTLDSGSWSGLEELKNTDNTVKAFSNVAYTVQVEASNVSGKKDFDMDKFKFSSDTTDAPTWKAFSSTGNKLSVIDATSAGLETRKVGYKYSPDASDEPGQYKAQLTYTISTS